IAAIGAVTQIKKPTGYSVLYNNANIPQLYTAIKSWGAAVPVFVLATTTNWADAWSLVLAIEPYAKRQHQQIFCINRNWHVSFTQAARCTEEQLAHGDHYLLTAAKVEGEAPLTSLIDSDGVSFYHYAIPQLPAGKMINFTDPNQRF